MNLSQNFKTVSDFACQLAQRAGCSRECFTVTEGLTDREYRLHWYVSPVQYKKIGTYIIRVGHNGFPTVMDWVPAAGFLVLATDPSFAAESAP